VNQELLKAMGRPGNRETALKLIHTIRERIPNSMIRTSIIAGFPGETSTHQKELLAFLEEAEIDWAGFFAYSLEEGTRAYDLPHRVTARTATARKAALEETQGPITTKRLHRFVGTRQRVLIEEITPGSPLIAIGRAWFQAPEVDGLTVVPGVGPDVQPGTWLEVVIEKVGGVDLTARPV
jgi:tRNA A37 methylthiotransferase MiaB